MFPSPFSAPFLFTNDTLHTTQLCWIGKNTHRRRPLLLHDKKNTNLITLESLFLYNIIMRKWIPRLGCARSVDKVTKAHSFQILFGDNQFSQVKRIQNTHTRLASATHFTHWPFFFFKIFLGVLREGGLNRSETNGICFRLPERTFACV